MHACMLLMKIMYYKTLRLYINIDARIICMHAHIHYLEPQKDRLYSIEHLQHNQALIITCYETF